MSENNLNIEAENKKLRNRLSEKSWYDLRAEIMKKDREIETLKKILEFSESDKQEWRDHKEIFNFLVKKVAKLKERIKELEAELNVLTAEGRPDKEKESVFEKRD